MSFDKGFAGLRPGFFNSSHSHDEAVVDYVVAEEHDHNLVSDESFEEDSSGESDLAGSISSLQDNDLDEVDSILSGSASVHSEVSLGEELPKLVSSPPEEYLSFVFGESVAVAAEAQQKRNRQNNKGNKKRSQQQQQQSHQPTSKKKHNKLQTQNQTQQKQKQNHQEQSQQQQQQKNSQSTQNHNSMNQIKTKQTTNNNNNTNTNSNNNNNNNNNKVKKQKQKQKQKSKSSKGKEIGKCVYSMCDIKDHSIYANDAYCRIWCTEKCELLLHQACWEVHLAAVRAENPMLVEFMPCVTPNCFGVVRKLHTVINGSLSKYNVPTNRIKEQAEIQRQIQRVQTATNNNNNNNNDNNIKQNNSDKDNNKKQNKSNSQQTNNGLQNESDTTKQKHNNTSNKTNELEIEQYEFSDIDEEDASELEETEEEESAQYKADHENYNNEDEDDEDFFDQLDPLDIRVTGVVTSVKDDRYGFILGAKHPKEHDNWKHTLFFHFGQVLSQEELPFRVGDIVEYSVDAKNERGPSAVDIILKERPAPSQIPAYGFSELGEVTVTKETYGFIHSENHPQNVFYHTSAVTGDVVPEVGDRVSFFTTYNQRTGKPNAVSVTILSSSEADDLEKQINKEKNSKKLKNNEDTTTTTTTTNNNNNNNNNKNGENELDSSEESNDSETEDDENDNVDDNDDETDQLKSTTQRTQCNAPTPQSNTKNQKRSTNNNSTRPRKLSYAESLLKSKQEEEEEEEEKNQNRTESEAILFSGNNTVQPTKRERIVSEEDEILTPTQPRQSPEAPIGAVGSHLEANFINNNNNPVDNENIDNNIDNNNNNNNTTTNNNSGTVSPANGVANNNLNGFAPQSFLSGAAFGPAAPGMPTTTATTTNAAAAAAAVSYSSTNTDMNGGGSSDPWSSKSSNFDGTSNNNSNNNNNQNDNGGNGTSSGLGNSNNNGNNSNSGIHSWIHDESLSLIQEAYERVQRLPHGNQLREQVEHNPFQHVHSADELLQMDGGTVLPFLQAYHLWMGRFGVWKKLQDENQILRRQLQEQTRQMPTMSGNPLMGASTSLYSNGGPHHHPHPHHTHHNTHHMSYPLSHSHSQQKPQSHQHPLPPHYHPAAGNTNNTNNTSAATSPLYQYPSSFSQQTTFHRNQSSFPHHPHRQHLHQQFHHQHNSNHIPSLSPVSGTGSPSPPPPSAIGNIASSSSSTLSSSSSSSSSAQPQSAQPFGEFGPHQF